MNLTARDAIGPMSADDVSRVEAMCQHLLALPQVDADTTHTFHAGIYARTLWIPAGCMVVGALIKIPTLLAISGHCTVYIGSNQIIEIEGYRVIRAEAGRKQAFFALEDTVLTMSFATSAATVEEAENEFTDEADRLITRRNKEED